MTGPRSSWPPRRTAQGFAFFAGFIALVAIAGWLLDIPVLYGAMFGLATMKIGTAAGMLLAATVLGRLARVRAPGADRIGRTGAMVLIGFGALIVVAQVGAQLAWLGPLATLLAQSPGGAMVGRPSVLSGVGFVLLGFAFLNTAQQGRRQLSETLFVMTFVIALFSLVGMLFLLEIPDSSIFHSLALPTLLCFISLAFGGLFLTPEHGVLGLARRTSPAGVSWRTTILTAVLVPLLLGWIILQAVRYQWVTAELGQTLYAIASMAAFLVIGWIKARLVERADAGASAVFAAAPGALLVVDDSGRVRRANVEAERIFDFALDALLGRTIQELIPEFAHETMWQRVASAPEGVQSPLVVRSGRTRDGTAIELESASVAVLFPEGRRHIFGITSISERRRAELALYQSEQRFRQSFESASLGVAIVGLGGEFLEVNQALCDMVGYSEAELLAKTFQDITHPDDLAPDVALVQELLSGARQRYDLEKRYIHRDGSIVWISLGGSVVRDHDGVPQHFVAIIQNETERQHAQQQLAETLRLQSSILQAAAVAMITTDHEGRITTFNRGAQEMLGYTAEEAIGRTTFGFLYDGTEVERRTQEEAPGATPDAAMDTLRRVSATRGAHEREWTYTRKDGTAVPVFLSVSPLLDATGAHRGFLGVATDITNRKVATDALAASLREKETLLREIHHRVKNNLQVISSMLSLQGGGSGDEHVRDMFNEARERIRTMAMVHERLYRSSSLSTIAMGEHLHDLVMLQLRTHQQAGRTVAVDTESDPIALPIDEAIPLGLIANELVANAFKHGFAAGRSGRLSVSLRRTGNSRLTLRVYNDGAPLPEGADPTAGDTFGMRLLIALVSQIDGDLTWSNDGGVAFEVTFPAAATLP